MAAPMLPMAYLMHLPGVQRLPESGPFMKRSSSSNALTGPSSSSSSSSWDGTFSMEGASSPGSSPTSNRGANFMKPLRERVFKPKGNRSMRSSDGSLPESAPRIPQLADRTSAQ